jgi:FKBP-type peptidyl-prolyl cis-trans isomerase FkpA
MIRPLIRAALALAIAAIASVPALAQPAPVATAPSQIQLETLRAGTGGSPTDSDVVIVNYEGRLRDGTVFDANPRAPLPVSNLIPGFTEGLKRMQKGGQYRLTIPAALGYGDQAVGPIPANSDLVFTVELIDFGPESSVRQMLGMPTVSLETVTPGNGRNPVDGDSVLSNYEGRLPDGTVFDSNRAVALTVAGMIPGFLDGLKLMQPGGRYRLTIPASLAYGERGAGPIPPNSDLRFDVDLIAVRSMEEIARMMTPVGPPR